MPKLTSCGVVVVGDAGQVLLCHATGARHWDIPKGLADPGETPRAAAIRELYEEAGVQAAPDELLELGEFDYRPGKRLHLFAIRRDPATLDPAACRCSSLFFHRGWRRQVPEVDAYRWVPADSLAQFCAPAMARVLTRLDLSALSRRLA
ncbi:MAG TPA: NUDIX hydrolase [Burkholderiaceae bacterium]|nr:NUDIX hydrolase [Burkholderiaceae bacterium]